MQMKTRSDATIYLRDVVSVRHLRILCNNFHSRMKSGFSILYIFISVSLLSACTSRVGKKLSDVDSYIQDRPDSALAELEAMGSAAVVRPCDIAKYSLLHVMAIDKNYIDTTDLRLIEPAVEYYTKLGSKEDRMKSLFYLGRLNRYAGNYPDAVIAAMKAKGLAEETGDLYWRAMSASELGYVHGANCSSEDELSCVLEAFGLWEQYGDRAHVNLTRLNLALAYRNVRKKWTMPIPNWGIISQQLAIKFGSRYILD